MSNDNFEDQRKTFFVNKGDTINFRDYYPSLPEGEPTLEPAIYSAELNVMTQQPYLVRDHGKFTLPKKLFGDVERRTDDVISTYYKQGEGSMGVMMTGVAGSGKSLLAQVIVNKALTKGLPCLYYPADHSINLMVLRYVLSRLKDGCVVFVDEFTKRFEKKEEQGAFLSLFGDSELKNVLFIITDNDASTFSDYIVNRPGRFRYHYRYTRLPYQVAKEYAEDMGAPAYFMPELKDYCASHNVSIDVVDTVVRVAKRCANINEFYIAIDEYNVPSFSGWFLGYTVSVSKDGETMLPRASLTGFMKNQGTQFKGKLTIESADSVNIYKTFLDIDLNQLEPVETALDTRTVYEYRFIHENLMVKFTRFQAKVDGHTASSTAMESEVSNAQSFESSSGVKIPLPEDLEGLVWGLDKSTNERRTVTEEPVAVDSNVTAFRPR